MSPAPVSTRILLLRHGESEWNARGLWQGQADPPLSERGRRQAAHAAPRIEAVDRLVSSDLDRAAHTADILGRHHDVAVSHHEAGLRERAAGPWQGLSRAEIEERWPGYLESGQRPPGYEDDPSLLARTDATLRRVAARYLGASIVVVSHGGVIRAFERAHGIDHKERIPNLSGRWLLARDGRLDLGARVVLVDDDEITRPVET